MKGSVQTMPTDLFEHKHCLNTFPLRVSVVFGLSEKECHPHMGTCFVHLVPKGISRLPRGHDVVYQNNVLSPKVSFVNLNKTSCFQIVNVVYVGFPTFSNYLNVAETVLTAQPLTHHRRKLLVTPVVGTLATGRYAHKDSPGHLHRRQSVSYLPCCPPNGIVPAILEVKNPPVRFHILKRCPFQVSLRNVVEECKLNHIAGFKEKRAP